jgi:hypothetical protein
LPDSLLITRPEKAKINLKGNYSVACGTPEVVRELVSAFLASMPPGERPGKCRNKDNVEGPIANIGGMKGLLARRGFSPQ